MITFEWSNGRRSLMREIAFYAGGSWPGQFAANLAIASLLGVAGEIGYQNRGNDESTWRLGLHVGSYPERKR